MDACEQFLTCVVARHAKAPQRIGSIRAPGNPVAPSAGRHTPRGLIRLLRDGVLATGTSSRAARARQTAALAAVAVVDRVDLLKAGRVPGGSNNGPSNHPSRASSRDAAYVRQGVASPAFAPSRWDPLRPKRGRGLTTALAHTILTPM